MKKYILPLCITLIITACGNKSQSHIEMSAEDQAHVARNTLDLTGTYSGILPCSDCDGIQTSLTLTDSSYTLKTMFLGKSIIPITKQGSFRWNEDRSKIILAGMEDSPSQYLVRENQLVQLDLAGERITGKLSNKYTLKKE